MIHKISSYQELESPVSYVAFIPNAWSLENIPFSLSEKITQKIHQTLEKKENLFLRSYIGEHPFEECIFFVYGDTSKNVYMFLGEHLASLPKDMVFHYSEDNILFDALVSGTYVYEEWKTDTKEKKGKNITILVDTEKEEAFQKRYHTLSHVLACRDFINLPSNEKTPDKFVEKIKKLHFTNTKITIFEYEDILRMGLNLIDAVGKASASKPKAILLERIHDPNLPTIGIVGKGITFDTGWLDIKPEAYMYDMKFDMSGAWAVIYALKNIDQEEIPCNVVAFCPIVENAVSGNATRPGDIVVSYSGKSVEITNTDAEGRLILGDAIWYLSKHYTLSCALSIATLTGACIDALGHIFAWIIGTEKKVISLLCNNPTHDKYWELPFDPYFVEKTKGEYSDLKNYTENVFADASMGAAFISQFLTKNEPFVHIDIAGTAFLNERYGILPKGATGFWVESLSYLIKHFSV